MQRTLKGVGRKCLYDFQTSQNRRGIIPNRYGSVPNKRGTPSNSSCGNIILLRADAGMCAEESGKTGGAVGTAPAIPVGITPETGATVLESSEKGKV